MDDSDGFSGWFWFVFILLTLAWPKIMLSIVAVIAGACLLTWCFKEWLRSEARKRLQATRELRRVFKQANRNIDRLARKRR